MSDQPRAPLTTTTSIWPAAAILITGAVMLAVFMVINLVADQGVTPTTTTVPVVVGGLAVAPSTQVLSLCSHNNNMPSNISGVFLVPLKTSRSAPGRIPNAGAGDFDCYQPLHTAASAADLLGFYAAQLESRGWNLFSTGSSNGNPESLFQKAGNDGFYWVVGITVTSSSASSSNWTFRIYQNSQTI
ncbi:MAG: hypothetical protein HKL86_09995 [Acidimicrobiaceae bacterium]|nr:hypothetical protein [Acidimicrobiaceae bacterium]